MFADLNLDSARLFEHAAWVRRLAARLTRDDHEADDLAQDTWLAVLQRPLLAARSPRRFLAGMLRNRARHERRTFARRRAREQRCAPGDLAPCAAEAFERAELGRELARLTLELDEPFRSAVLLRFWDDLPLRAVAERLGVPLKTAESRVARGLARLRERWQRRHRAEGDGGGALLALLAGAPALRSIPAASAPASAAGSLLAVNSLGVLLVNFKVMLAGAVILGGGSLFWLWTAAHEPGVSPRSRPTGSALERTISPGETPVIDARDAARTEVTPSSADPATATDRAPDSSIAPRTARHVLRGRVLDPEAQPLPGVTLAFAPQGGASHAEVATVVSAADGGFVLETECVDGTVQATDPALTTLSPGRVRASSEVELLVVVAAHRTLAGRVVDARREPVARARVRLELPKDFLARFDVVLDATSFHEFTTIADDAGRFELERTPLARGATVLAAREGLLPGSIPAPMAEARELEIVLERAGGDAAILGRVVDQDGRPAPGSWVSLGARTVESDAGGEFRLDRTDAADAGEIVAIAHGHRPGRFLAGRDPATGKPSFPAWVELVLGPAPLTLRGLVVDEGGEPRADVAVWLENPTRFGIVEEDTIAYVESLAASSEAAHGDFSRVSWYWTRTASEGGFALEGLLDQDYQVHLMDQRTLQSMSAGPFHPGGEPVHLVFPRGELRRLSGRIVSQAGHPLGGVRVQLLAATFGGVSMNGGERTTDAEGRFAFEAVGAAQPMLWLRGDDVIPMQHSLPDVPAEEVQVVMTARCHLKVDLVDMVDRGSDPLLADRIHVLDASGQRLTLYEIGADGYTSRDHMELVAGRSTTLGVADLAAVLVLERGGVEVRRLPLALVPGRLNVVRP